MAEVLGLISSIAALIELSAKIAGLSYSYAREVKNAPKTQKQYLQEVSALIEVLYRVEQAVAESESTGLLSARPASLNEDALMDCYKELSPGVGKSYLASVVINHLLQERKENSLVVYFFCDFSSQNQVKTIDILHHLLRQIIDQGSGEMLSTLKESCGDPSALQNANQVVQLLVLAASVQPIYLVVDGLDEFKTPNELLVYILELAESEIHILVTSRDLPQIRKKMGTAIQLGINPTDSDLRLYVASRLQESDFAEEVAKDGSLINEIVSKTGNIFLLSRLLLDELLDFVTIHQMRKALQRSPQGLQQALEATIQRIDSQSSARKTLARRLLGWIMVAERRPKLDEVVTAFAVEEGEELQPDNIPNTDILLQVCAGLVVLNKQDNTLGLVHAFAYEVLHLTLPKKETNLDIARTCVGYLSLQPLVAGPCTSSTEMIKRLDALAFLDYSSKYWGQHFILGDCEKDLEPQVLKLLNDTALRNSAFQALQFRRDFVNTAVTEELFQSLPKKPEALHLAAYWGLTYIAGKILEAGASSSPLDSHKWTPLHWACANNKLPVAEILIRSGANVNVQDIQGWSPLFWAAFVGSIDMVRLLLSNGANHLTRSTLGWTALHWAISGGHTEIVKELLEHHSQSQSSEPVFHTMSMEEIESYANATLPVDIAATGQDANIFKMLIEHLQTPGDTVTDVKFNMIWEREHFDVPVSLNPWRTLTKGERVNGRESKIPRFTGRYADNSEYWRSDPKKWKSALLLSAIRDQQLSSVELLIKTGADVDYGSALCVAACREDPQYVQCLLENGANPNITDGSGRTALHEAVMNGFVKTIGALLDGGADVNKPVVRDSTYMDDRNNFIGFAGYSTPLHLLALCKEEVLEMHELKETVRLLLNGKCENGQQNTLDQPVRVMPSSDDEPNSSGKTKSILYKVIVREEGRSTEHERLESFDEGLTPLSMALQAGRWKMVQVLLELGATFPVGLDLTPILDRAIETVEPSMTSLLLQHGAHPSPGVINVLVKSFVAQTTDAKIPEGKGPSVNNLKTILKELVYAGADINYCQNEETPMTLITEKGGSITALNALLDAGADIYTSSPKTFDSILTSALFGETGAVACLLDYAVAHPKEGHWSKHLTEFFNESDCIMRICLCLQKANAINRMNSDGRTLLHIAAEQGHINLVTSLVSCGAKVDIADSNEWLAVHCAGFAERTAVLKFLLEQITESCGTLQEIFNKEDTTSRQRTMLDVAIMNQNIDMASILLEYSMNPQSGIDPNSAIRDWRKDVPLLSYAAENGYAEILSILLQHGADIEKSDNYGWRPLHLACYRGHTEIAKILIDAGADVHASTVKWNEPYYKPTGLYQDDPWTGQPLHLATMSGRADIVKLLLEKGVDIHASTGVDVDSYGCPGHGPTTLHLALDTNVFYGRRGQALDSARLQIAQWLVERGAMVRGIIRSYSLQDILNFRDFSDLWDALVAGDRDEAST
ncbi:hypothetical protein ZTR_10995 [Talaromyces verruculosus]|nr:hypothetical protein ZTR_10995 [Talaromyces verruculosus]